MSVEDRVKRAFRFMMSILNPREKTNAIVIEAEIVRLISQAPRDGFLDLFRKICEAHGGRYINERCIFIIEDFDEEEIIVAYEEDFRPEHERY